MLKEGPGESLFISLNAVSGCHQSVVFTGWTDDPDHGVGDVYSHKS